MNLKTTIFENAALQAKVLVWLLIFSRTVSAIRESERTVNSSEPWKIIGGEDFRRSAAAGRRPAVAQDKLAAAKESRPRFDPQTISFYDQMLDMSCLLGNVPPRFGRKPGPVDVDLMFRIARGTARAAPTLLLRREAAAAHASEMTKWFDTNYHYIVPEFQADASFMPAPPSP